MVGRVLIADDEYDSRTIASEALEAAGFGTLLAVNGEEAVAFTLRYRPDVILLDLSMPKMNGWDAVKRIKSESGPRAAAVIAFTAHAMLGDEAKALAAGFDDYLSKPCIPSKIVEKVKKWMSKGRT
jgi:two-component system cell cycle response regulator DivK